MCDTMLAPGHLTADGAPIFGKNSDREANEAQHLLRVPRTRHAPGSRVQCTYISIPQVEETYEVLLSKPFWIWGAEMGTNEFGVTIGNEAVFAKVPHEKQPGLIGMDLLRLALERARTAREALDVITHLLEEYGQGGNCGYTHTFSYFNSFIIADPNEAWVLETVARMWIAERVRDIRTISNGYTIGSEFDLASPDIISYAVDHGWCRGRDDFHMARCYADTINTRFSRSAERQCRTTDLLSKRRGEITVEDVMAVLRDHGPDAGPDFSPVGRNDIFNFSVCAHAGYGPVRLAGQSTGSMVSHLAADVQTHYFTATSAPCTGVFKPVWTGVDLPDTGPAPTGIYDSESLWWQHEILHRATLINYAARIELYRAERDALEQKFIAGAQACRATSPEERAAYSADCFKQAAEAEERWRQRVLAAGGGARQALLHRRFWKQRSREARMPSLA
ncbi:MAG: dipeptidase [Anaerolineae bacterium]